MYELHVKPIVLRTIQNAFEWGRTGAYYLIIELNNFPSMYNIYFDDI